MSDSYCLTIQIPKYPHPKAGKVWTRDGFFEWVWKEFGRQGLMGVHEGTVLADPNLQELDSGIAPYDRDWVDQKTTSAQLYFSSEKAARKVGDLILDHFQNVSLSGVRLEPPQDWSEKWRKHFNGIHVPPFFHVLPPWKDEESGTEVVLRVNPGSGFGTGTHETTQLCLAAIGKKLRSENTEDHPYERALDFGSGSGILSVAIRKMGLMVDGVEIDTLAIDNALENAELNSCDVSFQTKIPTQNQYDLIVANILKPVLLEHAEQLKSVLKPGGTVILSGLLSHDVPKILEAYCGLGLELVEHQHLGDWQLLELTDNQDEAI